MLKYSTVLTLETRDHKENHSFRKFLWSWLSSFWTKRDKPKISSFYSMKGLDKFQQEILIDIFSVSFHNPRPWVGVCAAARVDIFKLQTLPTDSRKTNRGVFMFSTVAMCIMCGGNDIKIIFIIMYLVLEI